MQIDADAERISTSYRTFGLVGDAALCLVDLVARLPATARRGRERTAAVRDALKSWLAEEGHDREQQVLKDIRDALPSDAAHVWDMTIAGYWAAPLFPALSPRRYLSPQGSGTLGYAWPAAIGAKIGVPDVPVLAISGDGGANYALQELASARQHGVGVGWLLFNDQAYGVLGHLQRQSFGNEFATALAQPDFIATSAAFGVEARSAALDQLHESVRWAVSGSTPRLVVVNEQLDMFSPSPYEA